MATLHVILEYHFSPKFNHKMTCVLCCQHCYLSVYGMGFTSYNVVQVIRLYRDTKSFIRSSGKVRDQNLKHNHKIARASENAIPHEAPQILKVRPQLA